MGLGVAKVTEKFMHYHAQAHTIACIMHPVPRILFALLHGITPEPARCSLSSSWQLHHCLPQQQKPHAQQRAHSGTT